MMGKMKDLVFEIEEMLMEEMPVDMIAETVGVPLAWVLEVKYDLIQDSIAVVGQG
jgi:hypothetical protein